MEEKIQQAYEKLKNMGLFSEDYTSFRELFYSTLDQDKKDVAIELLLMVTFKLLKSEGEVFNEILERSSKPDDLRRWLRDTRSRL